MGAEEPAESVHSASKEEQSAESQAAERSPETDQDRMVAAPVSPSTPREGSDSREVAASSRSSSLSSQPSMQQHNGMAMQQSELNPPVLAAPAAQASALAAQEEEPWQEVRTSRRRPVRQREPPKQSRSAPDQEAPAQSESRRRSLQAAAQPAEQASESFDRTVVPPHAQVGHGSAEQLPDWLAAISGRQPQRSPQQNGLDTPQPSRSDAYSFRSQPEDSQALPESIAPDEPSMAAQQMPGTGLQLGTFAPEQVRVHGCTDILATFFKILLAVHG